MSEHGDGEGFLGRWSRRKHEARTAEAAAPAAEAPAEPAAEANEDTFDPSSLPSLDSLGPDSDYTAFLKKGVPKALRTAALRKAWSSDPAIASYRTPAEYDWDFNAPGYGLLRPTDDPKRVVQAMFRHLRPPEPPAPNPDAAPAEPPEEPLVAQANPQTDTPPKSEKEPGETA